MSTTGGARRFSPGERSGRPRRSLDGACITGAVPGSSHEVNQPLNCRLPQSSQTPKSSDDEHLLAFLRKEAGKLARLPKKRRKLYEDRLDELLTRIAREL